MFVGLIILYYLSKLFPVLKNWVKKQQYKINAPKTFKRFFGAEFEKEYKETLLSTMVEPKLKDYYLRLSSLYAIRDSRGLLEKKWKKTHSSIPEKWDKQSEDLNNKIVKAKLDFYGATDIARFFRFDVPEKFSEYKV